MNLKFDADKMTFKIDNTDRKKLIKTIFGIKDAQNFEDVSITVFNYQYHNCLIYKLFCDFLGIKIGNVKTIDDIPFMPVDFYRKHKINCFTPAKAELYFESSTTAGAVPAKHYVADAHIYEESIKRCFQQFFGSPSKYCILALLPGYYERNNASLVYMVKKLMEWSAHPLNGFFLHEFDNLEEVLKRLKGTGEKVLLIGVTHALLDYAENHPIKLENTIVMETGGMKGRRKELVRSELHQKLKSAFGLEKIHSEYGMTELLSQAYSLGLGKFETPPWMKVIIRDINDPFSNVMKGRSGSINIIDLANVFSCSFIASYDMGRQINGGFEVLGRLDNSEIRGCNLMVI